MLVLSRKENQRVRFPELGITVEILGIQGRSVRLGFDAPAEVRIMRDELVNDQHAQWAARSHVVRLPKNLRHELRNELHSISIALHLFKAQVEAGHVEDLEATFDQLVEHIERISNNAAINGEQIEAPETDSDAADENPPTALLVEDEANEREMLAGLLRMHGYQVATASDGLEAINYLDENEKPNVILIDMRMPRCDGPTTIRRIRENPAFDDIKLFAISGSTPKESGVDVDQGGVNQWFTKPLNPKALIDAMAYVPTGPSTRSIA